MSFSFLDVAGATISEADIEGIKKASFSGGNRITEPGEYVLELAEKIDSKKSVEERQKEGKDVNWASRGFVFKDSETGKTFTSWEMAPVKGITKHASDSDKWTAFGKFTKFIKSFGFEIPSELLKSEVTPEIRQQISGIINTALREIFANDKGFIGQKFEAKLAYSGFHCRYEKVEVNGKSDSGYMLYDDKGQKVKIFLAFVEKNVGTSGKHPFKGQDGKQAVEKFMQEKKINLHKTKKTAVVNFDLEMRFCDIIKEGGKNPVKSEETVASTSAVEEVSNEESKAEEQPAWMV